jgi:hypothetical protein
MVNVFLARNRRSRSPARGRVRAVDELREKRAQLEMRLVVARVATAVAVVSEASTRAALLIVKQFVKDRATAAQAAAASATMERDSLAAGLAQAEAEVKELRATVVTMNAAADKATATTTTREAAAWDAAQTAA